MPPSWVEPTMAGFLRGRNLKWKEWGWVETPKRKCDQNILYEKNIEIFKKRP